MEASGELLGIQVYGYNLPTDKVVCYGSAFDLYSFGYFKRSTVREFLRFAGRTLAHAHRHDPGAACITVEEGEGCIHLHTEADKRIMVTAYTQGNYPARVVHRMLAQIAKEFRTSCATIWERVPEKDSETRIELLVQALGEYKKPENVDKVAKIESQLDDLKIVMQKSLQKALAFGEDLNDLVDKSDELSATSKMFYQEIKDKTSKRCCVIQ